MPIITTSLEANTSVLKSTKYDTWTPKAIESIGKAIGFKSMRTKYAHSGLDMLNPFDMRNEAHFKDFQGNATLALCEAVFEMGLMNEPISSSIIPFEMAYKACNHNQRYANKQYKHVFAESWDSIEQQFNIVDITKQIQSESVLENNESLKKLKNLFSELQWYVLKRIAEGHTYESIGHHFQKIVDSEKTLYSVFWKKTNGKICRIWIASKNERSAQRAVARKQKNVGSFISIEPITKGHTSYYAEKIRRIHKSCIRSALAYKERHPELF